MNEQLFSFIELHNLHSKKENVLLALSGGVDSTVMAYLYKDCSLKFSIAHINFQLRGNDSDEDEIFVQKLATQLSVDFFSTKFETKSFAEEKKISIQMAARELRYNWLEEIRSKNNYLRVATAHHKDDSAETVLLNIFRGTGIHGLHGILPKHEKIIRPMMCFSKSEILKYAIDNKISFREDVSNYRTDYSRNKIRLEIIPAIKNNFPSFDSVIENNISKWTDAEFLYNESVLRLRRKLVEEKDHEFFINIGRLIINPAHKTILYELLRPFSFSSNECSLISESLNSQSGNQYFSSTHRIIKDRKQLIISPLELKSFSEFLIQEDTRKIEFEKFKIHIEISENRKLVIPTEKNISCLNFDELKFPLLLRRWKKGDYFYPFGMKRKKKKLSDYFIDNKISIPEKENIWLVESNKMICCIIGERIDERFKIIPSASKAFIIVQVK